MTRWTGPSLIRGHGLRISQVERCGWMGARYLEIFKKSSILLFILYPENKERVLANMEAILQTNNLCKDFKKQRAVNKGYRPKCVSVLACVPLWRWAFLLFELYG
ncbi:hypothetical protein, partial [Bifidobacterium longum]|uniref:hypothetical protein n=5 Tax=Bifidobacterium longum TaxID=216816 RepID=UPI001BDDB26B